MAPPLIRHSRPPSTAVGVASAAGALHAVASAYWACGGTWLLATLGHTIVHAFAGRLWLLWPVVAVKLGLVLTPIALLRRHREPSRACRLTLWAAALVLIIWGGLNTFVGNLVLCGAIHPDGGYDHPTMAGHAWLWDPLFLVWGLALAVALGRWCGEDDDQRRRASISRRT